MVLVTLFPLTENVHILKDVGLLPYYLHTACGADAAIATYENGEYPYLESDAKGLRLEFIDRTCMGAIIDGMRYIRRNARRIDVLNIYHLNLRSFFYALYFRLQPKKGLLYMKLDMDMLDLAALKKPSLKRLVKNITIRLSDIISCESTLMERELKKLKVFKNKKLICVADGLYRPDSCAHEEKRDVFLTVGRLGCEQKATEVLLEAFALTAGEHSWSLRLAGGIEPGFEAYIDSFFERHPELRERIVFTGMITDKLLLQREYSRARVFVLPSRWESFGIALAEAAACGCYIITTDVVPTAGDITDCGKYGRTVPMDDVSSLASALLEAAKSARNTEDEHAEEEYTVRRFDWQRIAKMLYAELSSLL